MICPICKKEMEEKYLHEHHLVPKYCFKGFKEIDYKWGKKNICKKCHDVLHKRIEALIFREFVSKEDKERCKIRIKRYAEWVING